MVRAMLLLALVAAGLAAAPSQPVSSPASRAMTGVRVAPIGASPGIENATIVIRDGGIAAVGAAGTVQVPARGAGRRSSTASS